MRRDRWFLFASIILVVGFILFNIFSGLALFRFFGRGGENLQTERERLRVENMRLKAENAVLLELKRHTDVIATTMPAFVYSRYPFNLKSEFLINAGSDKQVEVGHTVLLNGLFLGKISKVFRTSAVVQTIFDSHFEMAVRLAGGTDALLKGGDEPKITLIPKSAAVMNGEIAYSAAPGIPYGLPLGEVRDYRQRDEDPFGEAFLRLSYALPDIKVVEIVMR